MYGHFKNLDLQCGTQGWVGAKEYVAVSIDICP